MVRCRVRPRCADSVDRPWASRDVASPAGCAGGQRMILRVDASSAVPPYEQIRSQLATIIATGLLRAGQRLPSIRQLAADLGLAGGTVARAFRELEQGGFIISRGRHGTFVSCRVRSGSPERG